MPIIDNTMPSSRRETDAGEQEAPEIVTDIANRKVHGARPVPRARHGPRGNSLRPWRGSRAPVGQTVADLDPAVERASAEASPAAG